MSNENTTPIMKSLKERAKEFSARLPFMDGREKGKTDELVGTVNTIVEYGFLPNEQGQLYAAFIVKERSGKFYFGGTVLTDQLMQLDQEGYHEAIVAEGLPMLMTEKRSKNGRTYTNVSFFPED